MKTAVFLHLCISCILISLVLVVRCDDEGDVENEVEFGDAVSDDLDDAVNDDLDDAVSDNPTDAINDGHGDGQGDSIGDVVGEKKYYNYKCLVCRAALQEMEREIENVDPRKRIDVTATKSIQYSKSEVYLTDLIEKLCDDDGENFSIIRQVVTQKTVIRDMLKGGGNNFDYTPGDLNDKLNHFCLEILEENDEIILKYFTADVTPSDVEEIVCTETAKYCGADDVDVDEVEADTRDEL